MQSERREPTGERLTHKQPSSSDDITEHLMPSTHSGALPVARWMHSFTISMTTIVVRTHAPYSPSRDGSCPWPCPFCSTRHNNQRFTVRTLLKVIETQSEKFIRQRKAPDDADGHAQTHPRRGKATKRKRKQRQRMREQTHARGRPSEVTRQVDDARRSRRPRASRHSHPIHRSRDRPTDRIINTFA